MLLFSGYDVQWQFKIFISYYNNPNKHIILWSESSSLAPFVHSFYILKIMILQKQIVETKLFNLVARRADNYGKCLGVRGGRPSCWLAGWGLPR